MSKDKPGYQKDWQKYWEVKYQEKAKRHIKTTAKNPAESFLSIDVREINPEADKYDYEIQYADLIEHPDSILNDARRGFRDFVDESDIDVDKLANYDLIPLHIIGMSRINTGRAMATSIDGLYSRQDKISHIRASPISVEDDILNIAVAEGYECPAGHQSRVTSPIYSQSNITTCPNETCTNTPVQISSGTTGLDVVNFDVEFGDSTVECLAYGNHSNERRFENLKNTSGRIKLTGILRNTVSDGQVVPVFEALYLSNLRR